MAFRGEDVEHSEYFTLSMFFYPDGLDLTVRNIKKDIAATVRYAYDGMTDEYNANISLPASDLETTGKTTKDGYILFEYSKKNAEILADYITSLG